MFPVCQAGDHRTKSKILCTDYAVASVNKGCDGVQSGPVRTISRLNEVRGGMMNLSTLVTTKLGIFPLSIPMDCLR